MLRFWPVFAVNTDRSSPPKFTNSSWGRGFAGTVLLTGQALLRVAYTGQQTLYGAIITSVVITTHQETPLQRALARLILTLIIFATFLCLILAVARYIQGFGIIDALLSAAVLAIAALPDEFPVVFTFFLGLGVFRLAQKNALVRQAVSIENIGRVTTICSDKTGTITEGKLQLLNTILDKENELDVIRLAAIASRIQSGDPLDLAIHKRSVKNNIKLPKILATFPFSEERLRETSVIRNNENKLVFATKGSPEKILSISNLSPEENQYWQDQVTSNAKLGYKVIAIAYQMHGNLASNLEPIDGYTFAGLLIFYDPIRVGVQNSVAKCLSSGIHVLIITGDHPETARTIAKELGLGYGNPNVMLANEAYEKANLSKENFYKSIDVIARAIPSQKLYIVKSLQKHSEIVVVTGDGVNDVPALKIADIGIAMGQSGSQGAREAAKIVLLDDNFSSIVNAISEGRQLFKNLQLSFTYLLMVHIPFIFSAAIIPLFGYPLLFQPVNIILIELMIHPTCMLVFQDLPASEKLARVQQTSKINFFSSRNWFGIIIVGIFTTTVIVISYISILNLDKNVEHARAFSLGALGVISAAITIGLSNLRTTIARTITILTVFITIVSIQTPWIAQVFIVTPLQMLDWGLIFVIGTITMLLARYS